MKFIIYNGSLKADAESNTFSVCQMLKLSFEKLQHECEIITLRDLNYEGSTSDIDDDLKPEIMKMFDLSPGKEVGKIKTMVEDAIINGEISNDYSSAMSFLDQIKQQKK